MKIPVGVFHSTLNLVQRNLQAQVQALGNENKLVQIKYYGWRMTMFDEYRNAVAVKEISGDVTPSHPILSWVFYAFLLVTLSFLSNLYVVGSTAKISVSNMGVIERPHNLIITFLT